MNQQIILIDQMQAKYNEIINKLILDCLTLENQNAQLHAENAQLRAELAEIKNGLAKSSSKPKEQGKEKLGIIDNGVAQNK